MRSPTAVKPVIRSTAPPPRQRSRATIIRLQVAAVAATLLAGCNDGCNNDVVSEVKSPDGARKAVLFQRDCGASTGYSTQISILDRDSVPSAAGNVFIADARHGTAEATKWGGPWADAHWLSSDRLVIRYDQRARVFKAANRQFSVTVTYTKLGATVRGDKTR